ncbi:MAG: CopG family transcriptional regulator [Candidatus Riflebacteria bacterium]|nr:CopG family transcriptional regulator [Candidatus Riflebacteria bacterium]
MTPTTTMTIRLPVTVLKSLDEITHSTDQTKSYLATKAIEEFIATQEWQGQAIEEAVRAATAPDAVFHDHADVTTSMKKKIAAARKSSCR